MYKIAKESYNEGYDWKTCTNSWIRRHVRQTYLLTVLYPVGTRGSDFGKGARRRRHFGPPRAGVCTGLTTLKKIMLRKTAMSTKRCLYYCFSFPLIPDKIWHWLIAWINDRWKWHYIRSGRLLKKISNARQIWNSARAQLGRSLRSIHQIFVTHIPLHGIKILNVADGFSRKLTVFVLWLFIMVFTGLYGHSFLRLKDMEMFLWIKAWNLATGIRFWS